MAHTFVAYQSLLKGIGKLELNRQAIDDDLENNWAVVAEAIQTILRKEGYPNPYEALKELTRKNEKITREGIGNFIDTLQVTKEVKDKLKSITPFNYTGI
jgi:adenylosuccinate lyase